MDLFKPNEPQTIFITCAPYLVDALKMELAALGHEPVSSGFTFVEVNGRTEDIFRLNYFLRTASHVYILIRKFDCHSLNDLYAEIKNIYWEDILFSEKYLSIESRSDHPSVNNSMFLNQKIKDAVVDRLREKTGERPNTGPLKNEAVIYVFWQNETAAVYADTSGQPLYKHGYRIHPGYAPLQESLAAAMIYSSKWDQKSSFINPMCGSGTLALEAAMTAANLPSGMLRKNFAFMHLKNFSQQEYDHFLQKNKPDIPKTLPFKIVASDSNKIAVQRAKEHARLAGVYHLISFMVCKAEETTVPDENGVLFFNPPYGERLGETEKLIPLYKKIGDFMKQKAGGYTGYVLTANKGLGKMIGLKPSRKIPFKNGALDCLLYEFNLYIGTKKIQNKVFKLKQK
jgi:putative N6-adenine-specific DNA methylase